MKKATIITLLMVSVFAANAQIGIRGGATLSNLKFDDSSLTGKNLMGVNLGITNAFGSGNTRFKTGLIFVQKGFKVDLYDDDMKFRMIYIDIPLNVSVKITEKLIVEGGPYLGIGLFAYTKYQNERSGWEWFDDGGRLEGGVNAGISYLIQPKLQLGLSYNLGLLNIDDSELSNRYANLTLTYLLSKKTP